MSTGVPQGRHRFNFSKLATPTNISLYAAKSGLPLAATAVYLLYGLQLASAKQDLLDAIAPLKRGLTANDDDIANVESLTQRMEKLNPNPK